MTLLCRIEILIMMSSFKLFMRKTQSTCHMLRHTTGHTVHRSQLITLFILFIKMNKRIWLDFSVTFLRRNPFCVHCSTYHKLPDFSVAYMNVVIIVLINLKLRRSPWKSTYPRISKECIRKIIIRW